MEISQIWRYPVKSMLGEPVERAEVDESGIVGDRVWACRDLERGGIRGAKKISGLMALGATVVDGGVTIRLPDGRTFTAGSAEADAAVSGAVGRRVRLEALHPAGDLDHYRRGAPDHDDVLAELRSIFGLEADEPLPDLSIFPPAIAEYESPPGTYVDAFPLLVMTDASLRSLAALAAGSVIDVRRFRPSVLVRSDEAGFPEQGWVGRQVRLGSVLVEIVGPCPRCVMTTHGFADLPRDPSIMRTLVRETAQMLGVYATVVEGGPIAVGDLVAVV